MSMHPGNEKLLTHDYQSEFLTSSETVATDRGLLCTMYRVRSQNA